MHNISTGKNIGCSVCFYGFGAATSAVGVTAGASITRITVFACSGGQGATVRVQSITALTCPPAANRLFRREARPSLRLSAASRRSGTHRSGAFPAAEQNSSDTPFRHHTTSKKPLLCQMHERSPRRERSPIFSSTILCSSSTIWRAASQCSFIKLGCSGLTHPKNTAAGNS